MMEALLLICPTLIKNELEIIPYFQHKKKWTGWDLNPRPKPSQFLILLTCLFPFKGIDFVHQVSLITLQ